MSELVIDGAAATLRPGGSGGAGGPGASTGTGAPGRPGTGRPGTSAGAGEARPAGWWRAWRARFGLAELCGTLAALAGFAAGYLQAGSLLAAAGLATICEAAGFYGCIGAKTAAAARRATAHLIGWRRLAAGAWHAARGTRRVRSWRRARSPRSPMASWSGPAAWPGPP